MSSNETSSSSSSAVRAKRPRLSSPVAAATANDSHSDQEANDATPPSPHPNRTADDSDDGANDASTQSPPSAGPAPRKLKPYRLRPDTAQPTTSASAAVHAQAALLREVLAADLQAEETMLANLSDSVAAEFSRTLIEQSHLRATYAHWAAIPDTDPFWSQPDMLMHFAPHPQDQEEESVFAPPSVQAAGQPGPQPPQDLFSSVRPGSAADDGDETDEDLASLFAYLPVPSSVSPTQDAACMDPSELQADEEPPLDLDTLEELLGIAGGGGTSGGEGAAGYRPPPRPTQMIDLLAGARNQAEEGQGQEMEVGGAESQEQQG